MAITTIQTAHAGDDDFDHSNDPTDAMRHMFGPGHVDQIVRQAIQSCWMALPKERRNITEVEKEMHRLLTRALANLREDITAFDRPGDA